jgi:hypothetical protein
LRLVLSLFAIAGVAGVLGAAFGGWLAIVGAAIAGGTVLGIEALRGVGERRNYLRAHLVEAGRVRVAQVDPFSRSVGVFRSTVAERYRAGEERPPYVPRAEDRVIRRALRRQSNDRSGRQLILVRGPALIGKTRTAYEALLAELPNCQIAVPLREPDDPPSLNALVDLVSAELRGNGPVVLWLDRLEALIDDDDVLDASLWRKIRDVQPRLVVVATIADADFRALAEASVPSG